MLFETKVKSVDVLKSRLPGSIRSTIRTLRDYFHYRPMPGFRVREVVKGPFSSIETSETLQRDGICILVNYLNPEELAVYRAAVISILDGLEGTECEDAKGKFNYNNIDFTRYPLFLDLILDELILAAFEAYYARPIYLALTQIQRLNPIEPYEERAFRWHHDSKGKYVKAMWLFSDVPPTGQRMSYVIGSHTVKHPWTTYEETRFTDEQARAYGEVLECAAPAGSVILFDTNGIHRGNRNQGPRRDTMFGVYSAGRYLHGCRFDLDQLTHLTDCQRGILKRSRTASKGYASAMEPSKAPTDGR